MPADLATSVAIPISEGKRYIMNCGMYRCKTTRTSNENC